MSKNKSRDGSVGNHHAAFRQADVERTEVNDTVQQEVGTLSFFREHPVIARALARGNLVKSTRTPRHCEEGNARRGNLL